MIVEVKESHPSISERDLCRLFSVSRSWYYERRPSSEEKARRDVALRDAIERIILEFPGYVYNAESPRNRTDEDGRSTTSGS